MRDGRAMRNSLVFPDKLLARFSKILSDYDGKINTSGGEKGANDASSTGSAEGVKKEEDGADVKKEGEVAA